MAIKEQGAEVTALVVEWIRARRERGDTLSAIARDLGVSKQQIMALNEGVRGAGPKVETAYAKLHYGGSIDALRAAARQAAEHRGAARATGADLPATLRAALEFTRSQGPVPDVVVERAREIAAHGTFAATTWIALLHDLVAEASARRPN